ncbi:ubiquitin carboxy-terminal hydrolase (macronuclear) [Tetrahymena thermophila SB210]|uniref:ubiquitinyl hydrolase 1 n=1 Tax=Tetrahymena thermophila (strain SB210) TaxID=312017 RepID=Q23JM8_TETTS|nr:ubiquitin carboxy-terminal hydrolase [Tetrahymena thermophila SB210]EAR96715.2 ubiquitin carboxy-terminal hydrolase [Tetrahymena thermophila SB210]|eukprot:XP_001016960.2 ubiquitin carboxy-terminal hydrolase [Tetrahymena thermophila SB210]
MGICGIKIFATEDLRKSSLRKNSNKQFVENVKSPLKRENKLNIDYCQIPNDIHQSKQRYNELTDQDPLGLVGISNLGNTCFINSALQCLLNVQPLMDYFLSDLHNQEVNTNNPLGSKGKVTYAFADLVNMIWCQNNKYIVPKVFLNTIQQFSAIFGDGSQQDSQEFLIFLLDLLHEDLNRVKKKPAIEDKDYQSDQYETYAAESWKNYLLRNKSIVVDLFQGQLKSTLKCLVCETVSHKFDTFMYLSVPIPQQDKNQSKGIISIEDCIEEFTKEEKLDKSEWWLCTSCKKRTPSTKKIDLWKTPNILIIHLKRFSFTKENRGKINKFIDFKITQFDLSQKVSGKEKMRPIYDLFSVCNHSGNLGGGHYTAYAKNRDTQDWYLFDDSKVYYVKNPYKEIISQKAYVLFYSKTSVDKFQRQTISRPEFWPHFINNSNSIINQNSLNDGTQNQKKSVSALSIQKQDSRVNQQNILSQNNISSVKSTPQQSNGKQFQNQISLFDDENRQQNLEKSNQMTSRKQNNNNGNMTPIYEQKPNEFQENLDRSPIIKGNKQGDSFMNDSDFMPSVIAYNYTKQNFNGQRPEKLELIKKDQNLNSFSIKPYPLNEDEYNNQNEQSQQTNQNEMQSQRSFDQNENKNFKFKVKRISVNKRQNNSDSKDKLIDQDKSLAQKDRLPPLIQFRNNHEFEENSSFLNQESQTNQSNQIEDDKKRPSFQNNTNNNHDSTFNNSYNNTNNNTNINYINNIRYQQNRENSPNLSFYHNSSMGEIPSLGSKQYKTKNSQHTATYKGGNDQHLNEYNQTFEVNQKMRNGKQNHINDYQDIFAKPNQNGNYLNSNLPRIIQDEYNDQIKQNGTTLNTQISIHERQSLNGQKLERFSDRKSRNNLRNNEINYLVYENRQGSQSNFMDIYLEKNQDQQNQLMNNPQINRQQIQTETQRHLSYDQAGRRNKYNTYTPEKHKYFAQNESKEAKANTSVAVQMLIDKKLTYKPPLNNNRINSNENSSNQLIITDSSSKNKIGNQSQIDPRQILASSFNSNQNSSSNYESSPVRAKRTSNIASSNSNYKYNNSIQQNNSNNFVNNNNNNQISNHYLNNMNSSPQKNYIKNH